MIVPLGEDYLELIAVVDEAEAATSRRSLRVREAVESGLTFAGWAVRTDEIDRLRAELEGLGLTTGDVAPGARDRPDGVRLSWRTLTLAEPGPADPFFIEWRVPRGVHPAETPAAHRCRATGIRRVTVGSTSRVIEMLEGAGLPVTVAPGANPGLVSIELDSPAGPLTIR